MSNYKVAKAFDDKHNVFEKLCDAFEATGGCGHDLGVVGAVTIIQAWEKMRSEPAVKDLSVLTWSEPQ